MIVRIEMWRDVDESAAVNLGRRTIELPNDHDIASQETSEECVSVTNCLDAARYVLLLVDANE